MDQVGKINACATSKSFEVWNLNRTIVAMLPLFTKSLKNDSHLTRHCSMKKLHSTFMYLPDLHRCSTGCCNNVFLIRSDYEPVCLGVGFWCHWKSGNFHWWGVWRYLILKEKKKRRKPCSFSLEISHRMKCLCCYKYFLIQHLLFVGNANDSRLFKRDANPWFEITVVAL